jgi:hypothetical protein
MLLSSALDQIRFEVDSIIRQEFGTQLFQLTPDNAMRLLKLRVWSVRYKVSVRYILVRLVPHYKKFAQNFRRRYNEKGLGITIAVLTGRMAEEKLREFIAKDFADGENTITWKEDEKQRCLNIINQDELVGRPKPFLHYRSVKAFVAAYEKRVRIMNRDFIRIEKTMALQPWRGNPWR